MRPIIGEALIEAYLLFIKVAGCVIILPLGKYVEEKSENNTAFGQLVLMSRYRPYSRRIARK